MSALPQKRGDLLGGGHGQGVDDSRARELVQVVGKPGHPVRGVRQAQHTQAQALPVQRAAQHQRVRRASRAELLRDVGGDTGVGGGGGGEHRHAVRQVGEHGAQPPVVRAEVVPPVGDAVRLVDHEQPGRRGEPGQDLVAEVRVVEPLGAHQQHIHVAGGDLVLDRVPLLAVGGVDRPGLDPGPGGRLHLVAHESQERGNDHRGPAAPRPQQRRGHEVHGGLAPARALDDQCTALVGDERLDRPPLVLAQPGLARGVPDETGEDRVGGRPEIRVARVLHGSHTTGRRRHPVGRCGQAGGSTGNPIA